MNKAILAVLALAVAATVAAASEYDFVKLSSGTMTNGQATITLTNATPVRGCVKSVAVVLSASANATGTVAITTAPAHGMAAQTLLASGARVASVLIHPGVPIVTNGAETAQWDYPVLFDDKIILSVGTIATTGTVSATGFVIYEREF